MSDWPSVLFYRFHKRTTLTIVSQLRELRRLIQAELDYASFNAHRTSPHLEQGDFDVSHHEEYSSIADPSRPQNAYYNRFFVHPETTSLQGVLEKALRQKQAVELLSPQQTEENFGLLRRFGFEHATRLYYLIAKAAPDGLPKRRVSELCPSETDLLFDLLELSGAEFPDSKRRAARRFYCSDSFRCFAAYDSKSQPIGWATMYINNRTAFLGNAFTLPDHRGAGVHSSLLIKRLQLADKMRLTRVFSDVEPDSQSLRNCKRLGFEIISHSTLWTRASDDR